MANSDPSFIAISAIVIIMYCIRVEEYMQEEPRRELAAKQEKTYCINL